MKESNIFYVNSPCKINLIIQQTLYHRMNTLETIISILAVIMSLVGVIGTLLPVLPGMLLCAISMIAAYFLYPGTISLALLLTMLCIFAALSVLDYFAPLLLTKWFGGSKRAMWGVTAGMLIGLLFMPWGLIVGPLIGAFIGEYWTSKSAGHSLKVATYSFLSFMITTGMNFITSLVMTFITCHAVWQGFFGQA